MWNDLFFEQGQPCDQARIDAIHTRIRFELPEKYQEVIRGCGGGMLRRGIDQLRDDDELGCRLRILYGNGKPPGKITDYDLDGYAMQLMHIWEMPSWGYFIGQAEGEIHTPILLNLSNPNYPMGALICVDMECNKEVLIANSFEELWHKIESNLANKSDN
ncbi:hypothetical protein P4N68_02355 [Corynebacterium felinum]|uniref:Knr4/Smi1-like domain-containing protein n=1 Tax=Corynebacterium felinum TaxID=131318 RepID=A0ABU2BCC7_9CORY|nr:SMI1/KNR4 family protein [Corynebacterium felinum]MDF5819925.1 hypothetical protein [Corynebacterium felinum]MDR7355931.1 hypothetical protein [Corynebacterium felinum]WJY95270.1 hypothetical protein CFELI_08325 [Corynebacterium felinum]